MAQMTDVWKYMAGDSLTTIPATLTAAQKTAYPIAKFRANWATLSDTDKADLRDGLSDGTFDYAITDFHTKRAAANAG